MFDRISPDPQVMGGRACMGGMRIAVGAVVGQIAGVAGMQEVPADYPDLEPEDMRQAFEDAAWLSQERA